MSDPRRDVRAYDEVLAQLGEANSRRSIPTPALVCDLSLLLANIERMANRARDAGVAIVTGAYGTLVLPVLTSSAISRGRIPSRPPSRR